MVNTKTLIIGLIILIFLLKGNSQTVVDMKLTGHTSTVDEHSHDYFIDEFGNGRTSFVDNHEHEIYQYIVLEKDGHIHELWFDQDSGWHHNDLTASISGIPSPIGNLVGYTWSVDKTQHIVYVDPNYNVRELWFHQDSGWQQNNLRHPVLHQGSMNTSFPV